jgi:hypothetical protein
VARIDMARSCDSGDSAQPLSPSLIFQRPKCKSRAGFVSNSGVAHRWRRGDSGHFPDSKDQRNTVRGRVRYQATPRLWLATGVHYDTGLPFDFDGDRSQALAQ